MQPIPLDNPEIRATLRKIILATLLLVAAVTIEHLLSLPTWALLIIYLCPYLVVGWDTLREAAENITHGQLFNEDFLMSIATIGALAIGFLPGAENQFTEAVLVMLLFQVGELFETIAEGQSKRSIAQLINIKPDTAHVQRNGILCTVTPEDVKIGEIITIKPGEKVPLDGIVIDGNSNLDTIALTGESIPRSVNTHDNICSGCINLTGVLQVQVTKTANDSTAAKILTLVQNAQQHKASSENFITSFAKVYTPIVVGAAVVLAFLPPAFADSTYLNALPVWLYRALTFLVVSCPCALVISVPLSFFGGIGAASKQGILIKGANYLEALSKVNIAVFDKTGTLTKGQFKVTLVHPQNITETQLLHLAAHVEHYSNHPIAASLRNAYPDEATDNCTVTDIREIPGEGVCANVNGQHVAVGNNKLMDSLGADWHQCSQHTQGTVIHVAINNKYVGHVLISDHIKDDAQDAIRRIKKAGVKRTVMLTGDHQPVAECVAKQIGLDEYHAELLPQDKVYFVEKLLSEKQKGKTLAFVGDGINDAPVLARADIGIAMGGLGADAAIEVADVVLMDDKPSKIPVAMDIAKKTMHIAHQNIYCSIGIKIAVLALTTVGLANMGMAVFADVGVTILAVLNATRALHIAKPANATHQ